MRTGLVAGEGGGYWNTRGRFQRIDRLRMSTAVGLSERPMTGTRFPVSLSVQPSELWGEAETPPGPGICSNPQSHQHVLRTRGGPQILGNKPQRVAPSYTEIYISGFT